MQQKNIYLMGTLLGDLVIFLSSYLFAVLIKWIMIGSNNYVTKDMITFLPVSGFALFLLMLTYDLYKDLYTRDKTDIFITILVVIFLSFIISIMASYGLKTYVFPRSVLLIAGVYQSIFLFGWRVFIWQIRKKNHIKPRLLVIGQRSQLMPLAFRILKSHSRIYQIQHLIDVETSIGQLLTYIDENDVIMIDNNLNSPIYPVISSYCAEKNKHLLIIPDILAVNIHQADFIQIDDIPILAFKPYGLTIEQRFVKRSIDIVFSVVAILLTLPIQLCIMLGIKLSSPGPIFFRQDRVTFDNRTFMVIKYRTMVDKAELLSGPVLAMENDQRVTKIGKMLRSTRLDELPQLFNILLGDMSLVGPRPERMFFIDQFIKDVPEFKYRTSVKAGLTGLAQVLGKYTTQYEDKLRYDLMYIKNYSLLLDVKILLKTLKVILIKESSAGIEGAQSMDDFARLFKLEIIQDNFGYHFIRKEEYNV